MREISRMTTIEIRPTGAALGAEVAGAALGGPER